MGKIVDHWAQVDGRTLQAIVETADLMRIGQLGSS
jgi:hypothetical protein